MKKLFTLLLFGLLPSVANAADHLIDLVYYSLSSDGTNTATVIHNPNGYYGDVFIHDIVWYGDVPYSVTSIGDRAFAGCDGLTSVTIPYSVTSIGAYAFDDCDGLTSVTIPNSVTSIGDRAFYKCSGLTSVTLGKSVTSIAESAFSGCSSLTSVTIPNSVTSIGTSAFYDCSSLTSVTLGKSLTSIGEYAFAGCSSLTSVTIPNSVTSIGRLAFNGCGLTSVTIGTGVTSIGEDAFLGCYSLTSVHIFDIAAWCKMSFRNEPSNPLYYAHHLLLNGEEILDLIIPNSVTSIGKGAFRKCSGLTSVTIPNSVTSISDDAFIDCTGLTSVTIGNSVISIGFNAFGHCSGLTSVTIPNSVISIGANAFGSCTGLTSVTIGNSVTSIGVLAFYGCKSLTSVTIPNGVISIGDETFMYCSSLSSVTIPNSVTSIGDRAFESCISLTSVTIPNSVTFIGDHAFDNCVVLTSVTIGNSVISIGNHAFNNCESLTSVAIPNSVTSIGTYAFSSCSSLTDFYCYAENVPETNTNAFKYTNRENKTLHVPAGSVEDYRSTEPWSGFGTIVAIGDNPSAYAEYYDGTLTFYCDDQRSSREGMIYNLNEGSNEPEWVKDNNNRNVEKVMFDASFAKARPTTTYSWFLNCDILKEIKGIENLNTSEVTNMHTMFAFCKKLESIDVSHFDTRKVEDMGAMFSNCKNLKSIDLSHFDTSRLWMMMSMFYNCNSLTGIDLSSFNTSKVEYMDYLFYGCNSLKKLYLSSAFTSTNSVSCEEVFVGCQNLGKVIFTGDIPASINSTYFNGVGSANATAVLYVYSQYKNNYADKFDGNLFYGGYFTLQERNAIRGDVDGDGEVTEEDIAEVEKVILDPSVGYDPNKDVNHDGVVNVADIVEIVNIIKKDTNPNTGSGYFWVGIVKPINSNIATQEGVVTTYKSLDEALKAVPSINILSSSYVVVICPSSWNLNTDDVVIQDEGSGKIYNLIKGKTDIADHDFFQTKEKIFSTTTVALKTKITAEASVNTGTVKQVNSMVEASLTGCSRSDNGGILLTFTLKNVSGQDFGEVRVGHTGYYQNMEGSTDTGDEIHNLSVGIMLQNSGNWSDDVRFSFPAGDRKSLIIGIDNVSATAKSLTLQVGVYCETWEVQNDVIKFVNIPIQ